MANNAYFIITDISGYTEHLTESELEHAHEILQSLFDARMKHKTSVFTKLVSKPEQQVPESFRDFLEMAARAGYERHPASIRELAESGKITVN